MTKKYEELKERARNEDLSDYQKKLLEYIYKTFVRSSSYGKNVYLERDDDYIIEDVKEYYDYCAKKKSILKCIEYIKNVISSEGFRYYEGNIQLNDNHTMFNINKCIDDDEYWMLVEDCLKSFEKESECEVFLDGRMSRHVVVKDTADNFINYNKLRDLQIKYENELVKYINNNYPEVEN